jgi:hypothetical protein
VRTATVCDGSWIVYIFVPLALDRVSRIDQHYECLSLRRCHVSHTAAHAHKCRVIELSAWWPLYTPPQKDTHALAFSLRKNCTFEWLLARTHVAGSRRTVPLHRLYVAWAEQVVGRHAYV